jgi:hypothetical protein
MEKIQQTNLRMVTSKKFQDAKRGSFLSNNGTNCLVVKTHCLRDNVRKGSLGQKAWGAKEKVINRLQSLHTDFFI